FGIIGSLIGGSRQILLTSALLGFIFNYAFCLFNRRGLAVQDMLSNTITLKMPKVAHEGLWKGFKNRKKNN
ncbi:MAG: RDD family protein, partial [Psychrobacter sp.]